MPYVIAFSGFAFGTGVALVFSVRTKAVKGWLSRRDVWSEDMLFVTGVLCLFFGTGTGVFCAYLFKRLFL